MLLLYPSGRILYFTVGVHSWRSVINVAEKRSEIVNVLGFYWLSNCRVSVKYSPKAVSQKLINTWTIQKQM